jgi:aspartate kinase
MKVFKFGGASVSDAEGVRNLTGIVKKYGKGPLVVIVSAMGKTTNHLEKIYEHSTNGGDVSALINSFANYHRQIVSELLSGDHRINESIDDYVDLLNRNTAASYNDSKRKYDALVSVGELMATEIIAAYFNQDNLPCLWLDAREVIKTSDDYNEAKVIWDLTQIKIHKKIGAVLKDRIVVTQGFIGSTTNGTTTTLGREGSDFTAAIFSGCLDAESMTVWKDVPGILNADPKILPNTLKYNSLSYQEASEMTYYGVKAIHPKTIKPLANKHIPLFVRSFLNPEGEGTTIHAGSEEPHGPAVIFKFEQCLITFQVKDFTFVNEQHLSKLFHIIDELNIRINLMQNSAISISVCMDDMPGKVDKLIERMSESFQIIYHDDLQLITVKNYDLKTTEEISKGREILLEQRTKLNYQIVVKGNLNKPVKDTLDL